MKLIGSDAFLNKLLLHNLNIDYNFFICYSYSRSEIQLCPINVAFMIKCGDITNINIFCY